MSETPAAAAPRNSNRRVIRAVADYGPLVLFAAAYFLNFHFVQTGHGWSFAMGGPGKRDLTAATWWLVGGSLIGIVGVLASEKRIAPIPAMVGGIALVFGVLTIVFHDAIFLKLKPTIIDVSYAVGLVIAWLMKRNPLKALMGEAVHLSERAWHILTLRYALFFLASGIVNVVVWQTLSEEIWVLYKVGGQLLLLIAFSATQIPFIMKQMEAGEAEAEAARDAAA